MQEKEKLIETSFLIPLHAVPKNDLSRLRIFLKKEGAIFRQKFIYFEVAGKVELLEVEYEQSL